jgi:hypothetical protein
MVVGLRSQVVGGDGESVVERRTTSVDCWQDGLGSWNDAGGAPALHSRDNWRLTTDDLCLLLTSAALICITKSTALRRIRIC